MMSCREETPTTKRRQQLSTSLPLPTLPFDLLIEILCRLPVKLLSQLRCVSKSFNSLISDSKFAKKHLSLSTTLHRLAVSNIDGELVLFDTAIPSDFLTSSIMQSQLNCPNSLKIGTDYPIYVSSCDGILCFTMSQGSAVLWNPSIRKSKILSSLSLNNTWGEYDARISLSAYSFGYDHFIHNYKIVAISVFKDISEVSVCALGTNDWRRIQDFPYFGPRGPGIFVNGTVNWLIVDAVSSSRVIVSLDLKKEMYQNLPQPDLDLDSRTLGVSRDCLCIFARSSTVAWTNRFAKSSSWFLEVWIMKEYGNKESWTKLYCVPHIEDQGLCSHKSETKLQHYMNDRALSSFKNALYISKNDQLLMDFFELDESGCYSKIKLVVYHSKIGTLKIVDIQHFDDRPHVYIESLISPCP